MRIIQARPLQRLWVVGALALTLIAPRAAAQLVFTTQFTGGTAEQQNATTSALTSLASYFTNSVTLNVSVTIGDLGNTGTLGTSLANFSQSGSYFYATPLYNVVTNTDLAGNTTSITINMNNNASITWGYGASAPGAGAYSWRAVVMHEILHSMGFYDGIANNTGALSNAGYTIFDSFVKVGGTSGTAFTSFTTDADRLTAITSANLYWTGSNALAANGGTAIKLYAPATYESGSTYSHIDPSQIGLGGLLFPALSDNTYYAGPTAVELAIMQDMGWSVNPSAVPEPATYAVLTGLAALGIATWRRRRAA